MTEIEEIPLEPQEIEEKPQELQTIIEEQTENIEPVVKKGRGRPPGAKNKAKAKPKPKPKKPVEYEEEYGMSEEEEAPPPPRRRARPVQQPQELDRRALAAEVLGILQDQRYQRTSARRSHYASWFENMS